MILDILKIKVFRTKDYDNIISVHDVTKTILSRDSNYIENVILSSKFGSSIIPMESSYNNFNFIEIWLSKQIF